MFGSKWSKSSKFRVGGSLIVATVAAMAPGVASAQSRLGPGVLPTHFPGEGDFTPAAGGQTCSLAYGGGPLISKIDVVAVYWGAVSSTIQKLEPGYIQTLVSGPAWDALSEYNVSSQKIVRGSFDKAYTITPSTMSTSLDDSQVSSELDAQIKSGALPMPKLDSSGATNTIYMVFFAPGIKITLQGGGSCVSGGFCGYHSSFTFSGNSTATPYSVIPDMGPGSGCDMGCAPKGAGEEAALGGTVSHELSEAATDATPNNGWNSSDCSGEIGDICAQGSGNGINAGEGMLNGYTVQFEWSNQNGTCELTNPKIGAQGGCMSSKDCMAPTPICDTMTATCVACMKNSDCSGTTPICNMTTFACGPCTKDSDCSAPTPVCATSGPKAGACVQCATNAQCTNAAPVCTNGTCTGCKTNADCTNPSDPTCNPQTGACGPNGGGGGGGGGGGSSGGTSGGGSGGGTGGSSGGVGTGSSSGATGSSGSTTGGNGSAPGGGTAPGSGSSGCALSAGPSSNAWGFAGIGFGLAALARGRRRRRARG